MVRVCRHGNKMGWAEDVCKGGLLVVGFTVTRRLSQGAPDPRSPAHLRLTDDSTEREPEVYPEADASLLDPGYI